MNANAVICLMSLLSIWTWTGQGQTFQPQLVPDGLARVTANTVALNTPNCLFVGSCTGCEIWLVAALSSATGNFDSQNLTSLNLGISPYPTAFYPSSLQFFLTKVGLSSTFLCSQPSVPFIVGADGLCTGPNCNGFLPSGATVRFKYLLLSLPSLNVLNSTNWSNPINLTIILDYQTINDGLSARSGAMVVITTLLCVAAALLLLLFFIMLCVSCSSRKDGKMVTVKNSIRIPRYDTHNLKERVHPYDNPAYVSDAKNYSTSETLPKSGIQSRKL